MDSAESCTECRERFDVAARKQQIRAAAWENYIKASLMPLVEAVLKEAANGR